MDEVTRLYQGVDIDMVAIEATLNEGIAVHPENIPLLELRGTFHCGRGMLQECRADAVRLLQVKQDHIEARMMLCMLNEFEGADRQSCDTCYLDVVKLVAELTHPPEASQFDTILYRFSYVYMLLMARHPDAEKEKANLLSMAASKQEFWIYRDILENFDRERVLREILGQ